MMKVPATPAGIDALEELAAAGITLNVTLMFTPRQYEAARDAIWRGAQRYGNFSKFKSVYSIFVSRVDVYTEKHVPTLSPAAQGMVGIAGAKRIWAQNNAFWSDKKLPLDQELVFASTGTKKPEDPAWKYVAAFAGSDIETNPPATNDAVEASGKTFHRDVDKLPPQEILAEIDQKVNLQHMEATLMEEGVHKFTEPQKALLKLIAEKRKSLASAK
jgi:transaldolase